MELNLNNGNVIDVISWSSQEHSSEALRAFEAALPADLKGVRKGIAAILSHHLLGYDAYVSADECRLLSQRLANAIGNDDHNPIHVGTLQKLLRGQMVFSDENWRAFKNLLTEEGQQTVAENTEIMVKSTQLQKEATMSTAISKLLADGPEPATTKTTRTR
jgi:hypothetical protein